jgi:DNA-binding MarR family transcriptional regulator
MLTERGRAAAATQAAAREKVDAELLACVGPEHVSHTRRTLAVLCDLGRQAAGDQGAEE